MGFKRLWFGLYRVFSEALQRVVQCLRCGTPRMKNGSRTFLGLLVDLLTLTSLGLPWIGKLAVGKSPSTVIRYTKGGIGIGDLQSGELISAESLRLQPLPIGP